MKAVATFLSLILSLVSIASLAQVDGGIGRRPPGFDRPPAPGRPGRPGRPPEPGRPPRPGNPGRGQEEVRSVYLNRQYFDQIVSLHELTIGGYRREAELTRLELQVQPSYRGAMVDLLINGRYVQTQNVGNQSFLIFERFMDRNIGRDVRQLELRVRGSILILEATAFYETAIGGGPGRPPYGPIEEAVSIELGRYVDFRNDRIDLTYHIDRYRLQGYQITEVIVDAESRRGMGEVAVAINGYLASNYAVIPRFGEASIYVNSFQEIGYDLRAIELLTRGEMFVRRVTLRLQR